MEVISARERALCVSARAGPFAQDGSHCRAGVRRRLLVASTGFNGSRRRGGHTQRGCSCLYATETACRIRSSTSPVAAVRATRHRLEKTDEQGQRLSGTEPCWRLFKALQNLSVSSSAHLAAVADTGWPDQGILFDVGVHAGTLCAVFGISARRWQAGSPAYCRAAIERVPSWARCYRHGPVVLAGG